MKNGCLVIILVFLCLFLMCTIKVADRIDSLKPVPCVPLPEPKPIPIIKVPQANIVDENIDEKPIVEPVNEEQSQPLPEPEKIPIIKDEVKESTIQTGHWEIRTRRGGLFGLRTYRYKVWINDGTTRQSTSCEDGNCKN